MNGTIDHPLPTQVTRSYGLLEGFLARERCRLANRMIPEEKRAGRVLDIGCGSHPFFLTRTEFKEKFGLDKMVRPEQKVSLQAQHGISLVNYDVELARHIPFESSSFDVVTMLAVFEHIEPELLPELLAEIHRILKPGGMYLLTTPAVWTDGLLRVLAGLRLVSPVEIEEHKDAYTHPRIGDLLAKGGFDRADMRFGYFEVFLNLWVTAIKR
jgi:2-polyprenyl-3-methyl-5-hydroxy-6-metoxy-1,4-benzoquinol methylase